MKLAAKGAAVPQLRFPEFRGEWEKKTLGDIAVFFKGKGISKSDVDSQGETSCIRYGELYTIYGEVIRTVSNFSISAGKLRLYRIYSYLQDW